MQNTATKNSGKRIFLSALHHSDLTWQFPYAEYDRIRERQINIVLGFFERHPEFQFIFDQAYSVRNYLQRNPEKVQTLKDLVSAGKIELIGSYCIPDLNLSGGESFLRNCLRGRKYYCETFGVEPEIASLADAFGMPAQVPQMLSRTGYRYLFPGRMPNADPHLDLEQPFNWQSPDGSFITVAPQSAGIDKSSYLFNVPVALCEEERLSETLEQLARTEGDVFALYCTEVEDLDERVFSLLDHVNSEEEQGKRFIAFGRYTDFCSRIDTVNLPVTAGEFNPTFTGCYSTRIGIKQGIRKAENLLFSAELAAAAAGRDALLGEAWEQLNLAQFHDAACGCHHDAPNADVTGKLAFVKTRASEVLNASMESLSAGITAILNPTAEAGLQLAAADAGSLPRGVAAQKDGPKYLFETSLPPYGWKVFPSGEAPEKLEKVLEHPEHYCLRTDYFTADFSDVLPKISSLREKRDVIGQESFGELLFRREIGSLWSERLMQPYFGREHQEERVVRAEEGPVFFKVVTEGKVVPGCRPQSGNSGDYWPGFDSLSFVKEYIFPRRLDYFILRLTIDFHGCDTKISLRVPVELDPLHAAASYDTPFAAAERRPYFEVPYRYRSSREDLPSVDYRYASGDWPALQWVDYSSPEAGLAVANTGTPGHNIVGKNIFISLLRSGTSCEDGSMKPQPGSFDNGSHVFEFAFRSHGADRPEAAAGLGELFNRRPVVLCCRETDAAEKNVPAEEESLFSCDRENVRVSAIYPDQGDIILRAWENFGRETYARFRLPEHTLLFSADFSGAAKDRLNPGSVHFDAFEIQTFRLIRES